MPAFLHSGPENELPPASASEIMTFIVLPVFVQILPFSSILPLCLRNLLGLVIGISTDYASEIELLVPREVADVFEEGLAVCGAAAKGFSEEVQRVLHCRVLGVCWV